MPASAPVESCRVIRDQYSILAEGKGNWLRGSVAPVMVAIGAKFRLVSTLGERVIDAGGFYNDDGIDYLKKRPDELLVDIQLPPAKGWRASYQKLRRRGAFDFPVLGVAAWIRLEGTSNGTLPNGRVSASFAASLRLRLRLRCNVTPSPLRSSRRLVSYPH